MPVVEGTVIKRVLLEKRGDDAPPVSVSIEGISFLVGGDFAGDPPREGQLVRCNLRTFWKREGGRPTFWLASYDVLVGQVSEGD